MSEQVIPERIWIVNHVAGPESGVLSRGLLFRSIHNSKEEAERYVKLACHAGETRIDEYAAEAKVEELEAHQITCEMEDSLMEADFLRSQLEALGIVVETSVEQIGIGGQITTRTTRNKRAEDLEAKVAEQAATIDRLEEIVKMFHQAQSCVMCLYGTEPCKISSALSKKE
jgi:hypothetical protein